MARITLKGSFEDWEVIDNCTVVLDDYADTETEKDFIGLKIDNTKKQIIVRLHKGELAQIIRATKAIQVQAKVKVNFAEDEKTMLKSLVMLQLLRVQHSIDDDIFSVSNEQQNLFTQQEKLKTILSKISA